MYKFLVLIGRLLHTAVFFFFVLMENRQLYFSHFNCVESFSKSGAGMTVTTVFERLKLFVLRFYCN